MRRTRATCRSVYTAIGNGLRSLLRNRRGQAGLIIALLAPVIVGMVALAIDAALWEGNQRSLQGAADQSAIAGVNAFVLAGNTDSVGTDAGAQTAALAVANSFGYPTCSTSGCPCSTGSYGACAGAPASSTATQCINAPTSCLQVMITEKQTRYLSAVILSNDPVASAKATTTVGAGGACVLALDQKKSDGTVPASPPSVSIAGSSVLTLTACNLVNNLNDPGATKDESAITGSSILQATQGGQLLFAQTDQYFGGGRVTPTPIYGTSPAPDPYANRTEPTVSGCTYTSYGNNGNNSHPANITQDTSFTNPLNPGTYCGGLNINGAGNTGHPIILNPGTYIMDGGGFSAQGNAVMQGTGVTIFITCDNFAINSGAVSNCTGNNYGTISITGNGGNLPKLTLDPPTATTNPPSGTAGISMWISKNAPVTGVTAGCSGSCGTALFTGDANLNVNGAIYAPTTAVTYEGGSVSSSTCSQLVALTVNMSGGHNTNFSQLGCASNSGVGNRGVAQLVE